MATGHVASIVIGINDYISDYYRRPGFTLRYATVDAECFGAYLENAWPTSTKADHVVLLDGQATRNGITAAFESLDRKKPYELLIVYLAGHGEIGSDGVGWFCAADTQPEEQGITAANLDRLLADVHADITILLLDCCYAESVVSASAYFHDLGAARAKVFLCSARRNQLTFEDDRWGHGALSYLLLNALMPDSPLQKTDGQIAVEGTLLPYLCEQLPLLVFREKGGARQEPIMGAVSTTVVKLRTAATGIRAENTSVFEVVRARYRQFLAATAVVLILTIGFNQLLLYHFAIGVDGVISTLR